MENELIQIETSFKNNDLGDLIMEHKLPNNVKVNVDFAFDAITLLHNEEVKSQSFASDFTVEQYARWLNDTYQSSLKL